MVACLIELSCSIAPLSFSCFWTRAIPFLSFLFPSCSYTPSFLLKAPLLLRRCVWNVSYRTGSVRALSSEWILLPCSIRAFTPNNRTDKWRYLKSHLKNDMSDFLPHFTTTNYDTGALSLFAFWVAESVLWSQQTFCFLLEPFQPLFPLCILSPSLRPPRTFHPCPLSQDRRKEIVASECIELYDNEKRARGAVMTLMRHAGSRLTSSTSGLQTFIIPNTRWLKGVCVWESELPSIGSDVTLQVSQRIKLNEGGRRGDEEKRTQ